MEMGESCAPSHCRIARRGHRITLTLRPRPRKLPALALLGVDEVFHFLEAVSSLKTRVALTPAYAAGLRVSEVTGLAVDVIDNERIWSSGSASKSFAILLLFEKRRPS